jgi:hypothetical protein
MVFIFICSISIKFSSVSVKINFDIFNISLLHIFYITKPFDSVFLKKYVFPYLYNIIYV